VNRWIGISSFICAASALMVACHKGGGASGDGCKAGAFEHKSPDYCVELPQGYAAKPEETRGTIRTIRFENANGRAFEVRYDTKLDPTSYTAYLKSMGETTKDQTSVGQGPLPGGGYFAHVRFKSGIEQAEYMVHGPKGSLVCYLNQMGNDVPPLEAACKTLKWE
jgi:hypothetical protein